MIRKSSLIAAAISALALSPAVAVQAEHKMEHGGYCGLPAGEGTLNAVDVRKSKANISHKPIESIGWGEMTMDFAVLKPVDLAAFAAGERVHFLLEAQKDTSYAVAMMCSLDADEGAHEACMAQMHDAAMKIAEDVGKPCAMGDMDRMKGMDHGDDAEASEDHSGHH